MDVITRNYDIIARFQGGPNAGHTLIFNNKKHVLHTIPSGIFHPGAQNVIGNGVVIDPVIFKREIDKLKEGDPKITDRLFISRKAHLILPSHRILDAANEAAKGKAKIGSTLKGIGPTYMDKTGRNGLRVGDIELPDFEDRYRALTQKHMDLLQLFDFKDYDLASMESEWLGAIDFLRSLQLIDSENLLHNALADGKKILAEGAQGTLLDIDFGTYPFVTSSTTTAAGACTGLGVAPTAIRNVYGIFKAYCTRVGSGPFPTELFDEDGKHLQDKGHEFGSTTGRPRRCGWLDLPALKYAIAVNGVTELIMMKADVMTAMPQVKICTAYKYRGEETHQLPYKLDETLVEPEYETLPGWGEDLSETTDYESLPQNFKNFVTFIEEQVKVPVSIISVGPDRNQTIMR